MIGATYTQGGTFDVRDLPRPSIHDDEMLLQVDATSICGTDAKIVRSGHRRLRSGQTVVLGHEFVGTVLEKGKSVTGYTEGQRVGVAPNIGCGQCEMCARGLMNMCPNYSAFGIDRDGSHTEMVRIPAAAIAQGNIIPLSPAVAPAEAALAEPLSCAVNGVRVARVKPGDSVLILGAGPMGLFNLMMALVSGAAMALVVDLDEERLQRARVLGASNTFNSSRGGLKEWVMDVTRARGVDAAITAVPVAKLQSEALELLAPFGRLCLFAGLSAKDGVVPLDTNIIHYKGLIVSGMSGGSPQDYRAALKLIETRRVDVKQLTSHTFPIAQVEKAYEVALSGKGMKVMLLAGAQAT